MSDQKVWLLFRCDVSESERTDEVLGVYATQESAERAVAHHKGQRGPHWNDEFETYWCDEYSVQGAEEAGE